MTRTFKPGMRVQVPWGQGPARGATVIEVWGEPESPTQIRVELDPTEEDEEAVRLLLGPEVVTPAA